MASYSYMYITLYFFNQYVLYMTHCNRKKHASVVIFWITIFKQKTVNHVFTTYNFKCENYINEYLIQKGFTEYNSHYLKKSTFTVKKTKYMIVNSIALMLKEKMTQHLLWTRNEVKCATNLLHLSPETGILILHLFVKLFYGNTNVYM